MQEKLADTDHPMVKKTAERPTQDAKTDRDRLQCLFFFVRDEISFGFPTKGDLVPASETIQAGLGPCNTKATLLLALCRASGIAARIHFSLVSEDIQRGFFIGIAYWLMPQNVSHAWIEVEIDDKWRRIDSFINDMPLHMAAKQELARRGWTVGSSLVLTEGETSADLDVDAESFEQMAAVTGDHGVWDDPADYYASPLYRNRSGLLRLLSYRLLIGRVNRRVEALRLGYAARHAT